MRLHLGALVLGLAGPLEMPAQARPPSEFGFVHHETTGLVSAVVVDGREVTIEFDEASDPVARRALDALRGELLLANADGIHLVVVGVLSSKVEHTPSGPAMAASEPFRRFRLTDWYLKRPFHERVGATMAVRTSLRASDFEAGARVAPAHFVR